jgi:hypothetical protein
MNYGGLRWGEEDFIPQEEEAKHLSTIMLLMEKN